MEKAELERLIAEGLSQRGMASRLGVSQGFVKHYLAKYELKTQKNQYNKTTCRLCGETDLRKFYRQKDGRIRYRCKGCDNTETVKRFRAYKQEAVDYKGGKCEICGYNKCLGALVFHHKDPSQKDPKWTVMKSWPLDKIKTELDKCQLLCCRCHAEIHWGG